MPLMLRGYFYGKKSKYSVEGKLSILNETSHIGIFEVTIKYGIDYKTIGRWRLLYQYQDLQPSNRNQNYSKEFKYLLVEQYKHLNEPAKLFAI